jgi:hypothetical protein
MPVLVKRLDAKTNRDVFLNIPYDNRFRRLYIAYISGLVHLGLKPRATIEIPGSRNRIEKIIELIRSCAFSIHDLSRVELDTSKPRTPRFNMPFELGLAVAIDAENRQKSSFMPQPQSRTDCFVFESVNRRFEKSLSDLKGIDAYIHDGTVAGVMRELCNAFVRQAPEERVSVSEMMKTYRKVSGLADEIQRRSRANNLFEASVFKQLYFAALIASRIPQDR